LIASLIGSVLSDAGRLGRRQPPPLTSASAAVPILQKSVSVH
jgi:hypothetical protein